jgi:hypothetical protein
MLQYKCCNTRYLHVRLNTLRICLNMVLHSTNCSWTSNVTPQSTLSGPGLGSLSLSLALSLSLSLTLPLGSFPDEHLFSRQYTPQHLPPLLWWDIVLYSKCYSNQTLPPSGRSLMQHALKHSAHFLWGNNFHCSPLCIIFTFCPPTRHHRNLSRLPHTGGWISAASW